MERNVRGRAMVFAMSLALALTVVFRVSGAVRAVDFLRIFASGALFGVGLMGLIQLLRGRSNSQP